MPFSRFKIVHEWQDPLGARGEELRATWARLDILVNDESVTRVDDRFLKGVRDGIYGPLYPIAEWIAMNWWCLLHEVYSPRRTGREDYLRRHSLAVAYEGYVLPSLVIQPEGSCIHLQWQPSLFETSGVSFLSRGVATLERTALEEELRCFVSSVVARLEDQGVTGTLLAEEWAALHTLDPEERAFCRAAAQLGCDPFSPSVDSIVEIVTGLADALSPPVMEEFFAMIAPKDLREQAQVLQRFLDEAMAKGQEIESLPDLRREIINGMESAFQYEMPWEQGYRSAQRFRSLLAPAKNGIESVEDIGALLGIGNANWLHPINRSTALPGQMNAAVVTGKKGSPTFAIREGDEPTRVFALCRAFYEYLMPTYSGAALVTPAYSERQKANRAFAAEFIAPADQLRERLRSTGSVTDEYINELAGEFKTSSLVVRHQISNHRIAEIEETLPY